MTRNALKLLAGALAAVLTGLVVGPVLYYVAEYFWPPRSRRPGA